MRVLIIDNYDSFTFNLYQEIGALLMKTHKPFVLDVVRNDKISYGEILKKKYDRIVLSPGPGDPKDRKYFGVCADILIKNKTISVLGVCLGMQGMAHYFGGKVVRAKLPMHGKTSLLSHDGKGLFAGLPQGLEVMRYHSLIADKQSLPECFEITAMAVSRHPGAPAIGSVLDRDSISLSGFQNDKRAGEIMGLRHKTLPLEGIQFHPESFATEAGKLMLRNFLFQNMSS